MAAETTPSSALDRSAAVPALIGNPDDFLIIAGLAGPAKEIGALTKDGDNAFIFAGAMGGAVTTALGLAIAQPERRVLCVTGDGDLLMSLGALATVGVVQPPNLSIVCVDNALYQETGGQTSHTARRRQPCGSCCRLRNWNDARSRSGGSDRRCCNRSAPVERAVVRSSAGECRSSADVQAQPARHSGKGSVPSRARGPIMTAS